MFTRGHSFSVNMSGEDDVTQRSVKLRKDTLKVPTPTTPIESEKKRETVSQRGTYMVLDCHCETCRVVCCNCDKSIKNEPGTSPPSAARHHPLISEQFLCNCAWREEFRRTCVKLVDAPMYSRSVLRLVASAALPCSVYTLVCSQPNRHFLTLRHPRSCCPNASNHRIFLC